jgi:hypothetical protein
VLNIFTDKNGRVDSPLELFIPRDSFDANKTTGEILEQIKNAFITEKNAIKFRHHKYSTHEYFTITITSRETFEKFVNQPIPCFATKC